MSDSLITKKAIASGLKELTKKKSFDKITIQDITDICGLNRQTFYYHFQDKFALVNWIYYSEVACAITQNRTYQDWSDAVLDVLHIMKNEQSFYTNALNVTGQNAFQEYLFDVTKDLLLEIVDVFAEGQNIEMQDRNFIAEFYTYGLVGVVVQWARKGMKEPPQEIVERLSHFIDDSKRFAASRYFKEHNEQELTK